MPYKIYNLVECKFEVYGECVRGIDDGSDGVLIVEHEVVVEALFIRDVVLLCLHTLHCQHTSTD